MLMVRGKRKIEVIIQTLPQDSYLDNRNTSSLYT